MHATQSIPQFGGARFYHRAGEWSQFRLVTFDRLFQSDTLSLSRVPPPWNFNSPQINFGLLDLPATGDIQQEESSANLLMAQMLTAMMPQLSGKSAISNVESVEVTLSPMRFQVAY